MCKLTIGDEPEFKGDICYPEPLYVHKYTSPEAGKKFNKEKK